MVVKLCALIKPEAVSLVDSICVPDEFLNSVLGRRDGKIYDNLYNAVNEEKYKSKERVPYWKQTRNVDLQTKKLEGSEIAKFIKSKL